MPSIAIPLSLRGQLLSGVRVFNPVSLFTANEPGVWYDPSDLTTLFQDTVGTTPVTTPGQTVARINDKSGRGNHATQSTLASRPTYGVVPLGGRRNLLTYSEDLTKAAWTKAGVTITPDAAESPVGGSTADRANNTGGSPIQTPPFATLAGQSIVFSVWLKSATGSPQTVNLSIAGASNTAFTVTGIWQRFSVVWPSASAGSFNGRIGVAGQLYDVFVWGAQIEVGSSATSYQKVTTAFDVTEAGVQSLGYLSFDGVDDFLVTPTITPNIDKVQVFAGVRKLSDAAGGTIAELSTDLNSNNGTFALFAPPVADAVFGWRSKGTVNSPINTASAFPAPVSSVVTGLSDISGDLATLRVNGTQVAQSTADQGTGNYLAYPLYIGRRGGTQLPFNGHLYSLIVRFGSNLDANTITNTETWVNKKTGAY